MSNIVSITVINPAPVITAVVIREIGPQGSPGPIPDGALLAENNLSELTNPATARSNLGVYSKTEIDAQAFGDADFDARMQEAWLGFPNGAASLDTNGKVPLDQIPDTLIGQVHYKGVFDASTGETTLGALPEAADENNGWYFICQTPGTLDGTDFEIGDWIVSTGAAWEKIDNTDAVRTVAGRTGNIILTADDIAETLAKKWWNEALTRGTPLAGLNSSVGGNLSTTDTILSALGKLENRVALNDLKVTGADRLKVDGSNAMMGPIQVPSGTTVNDLWIRRIDVLTGIASRGTDQINIWLNGTLCAGFGAVGASQFLETGSIRLGTGSFGSGPGDVRLERDAANSLALRNGTSAQEFRFYRSFTSTTNYTRGTLKTAANTVELAGESAGSGDANIDIALTPKGTGTVKFGSHSAIGSETITGYITIKDAAGNLRKLAVLS